MLFFLHLLFIFITNNLFVRCDDNHQLAVEGKNDEKKSLMFYIRKCGFQNKEKCNEFITSIKKMTGDLEYEYNGDENLCMILRKFYGNERYINWEKVKDHIKKGATIKEIHEICEPPNMPETDYHQPLVFKVPFTWKHEKIFEDDEMKTFIHLQLENELHFTGYSELLNRRRRERLSYIRQISYRLEEKQIPLPIEQNEVHWIFETQCTYHKNPEDLKPGIVSSCFLRERAERSKKAEDAQKAASNKKRR